MKYTAMIGFSGKVTAVKGQVLELNDKAVINDLLKAEYIKPLKESNSREKSKQSDEDAVNNEEKNKQPEKVGGE